MPRRSSTGRLLAVEKLCAEFCQFMAQANAPVRYLDAAAAAACGWPLPKRPIKRLTKPEKKALAKEFGRG
jgi:hypothetical protein